MINLSIEKYKKFEPLWGNWYFQEQIGKGSSGEVFKIQKNEFHREYVAAVKVFHINKELINSYDDQEIDKQKLYDEIVDKIIREIDLLYKLKGNGNIITYDDHIVKEITPGEEQVIFSSKWSILPSYKI